MEKRRPLRRQPNDHNFGSLSSFDALLFAPSNLGSDPARVSELPILWQFALMTKSRFRVAPVELDLASDSDWISSQRFQELLSTHVANVLSRDKSCEDMLRVFSAEV